VPFWRLHYHLVWTTANREPLIDEPVEEVIRWPMSSTARAMNMVLHASGMVPDHVHVVASIPPTVSIADAVGRLKGAASHAINENVEKNLHVRWQREYGALSISDRGLAIVVEYVKN
jgi:putative transposase